MVQIFLFNLITLFNIIIIIVSCTPLLLTPKDDSFYKPEPGFENKRPGTVLRSRLLPEGSLTVFSNLPQKIKTVHQFLYCSTDSFGKPTVTVSTLLVPLNADPSKLVSYQYHEDSANSDCAPSYTLQKGSNLERVIPDIETLFIYTLLSLGYYVVVPDYEGPGSFFAVGKNSGHGILDSIRAVLSTGEQTHLQADAQVQLYGYSGGAFAVGWAVQLQPSYAPELKIIGTAFGGIPVNWKSVAEHTNGSPTAGVILAGIHGMCGQYPELAAYMDSILKPDKKKVFMSSKNSCLHSLVLGFAFQNIEDYFTNPDYLNSPIARKVFEENIMGREGTPKIPLFMYQAIHDEITPFAEVEAMYNTWCSSADSETSIEFVQDELSDHSLLLTTGAANAIHFLMDGFNNQIRKPGCTKRTTVTSALERGSFDVFGKLVFDNLNDLTGKLVGGQGIL